VMYRPRDLSKLLEFAKVTEPCTTAPLMAEVFHVHLGDEQDAIRVQHKLSELRLGESRLISVQRKETILAVKCQIHARL
jgi:hypothetical protein